MAAASNVNQNDTNLLNSFFTDLSKQIPTGSMGAGQRRGGVGGANFFNQTFNN